jgi:hypothetical protein
VNAFPERAGVAGDPVLCARWSSASEEGTVDTAVLTGDAQPLGRGDAPVDLAQADETGPGVDHFFLPRGRSAFVRAAGVTGEGGDTGALYFVDESGVVFGVHDEDAAKRLGLTSPPVAAPWPLLARLPRGPELSVEGASFVRDSVGTAP